MNYRRRSFITQLGIAGLSFTLPHWAQATKPITASLIEHNGQRTVTISLNPEPTTLTSFANTGGTTVLVSSKVLEGLLEYDHDLRPRPQLAKEWSISEDGLTYDLILRPNVTWHDGTPFTARDVAFSLTAAQKFHPRGSNTFAQLRDMEIISPKHIRLHLAQPAPFLILALSAAETPMLPAHLYDIETALTNPLNNAPIGTGPYKFKEWQQGSHIIYERNDHYWQDGRPEIDRLIFRILPDSSSRLNGLQNGQIDIGSSNPIPLSEIPLIERTPHLAYTTKGYEDNANLAMLEFNLEHPILANKKVRHAIAHAINREQIQKIAFYGYAEAVIAPISKRNFPDFHLPIENPYPFDIKKANHILDELGYKRQKDGHRFTLNLHANPFNPGYKRTAAYLRSALARIGIQALLHDEDPGSYIRSVYNNRNFDITVSGVSTMFDPTVGLQRVYYSKSFTPEVPFSNATRYHNPEVDRLLEAAAVAHHREQRAQLFKEFQKIVLDDIPSLPLVQLFNVTVYNKRIHGVATTAAGMRGNLADLRIVPTT